jgi:hypothetical protein
VEQGHNGQVASKSQII